ncbi:MAG: branched-chain amino acid ABC transporter permease [Limnochordaceae bacterium]|nr:branched-chain amino acid ABC transporter permease [Limnochordaceae bacterium]
MELFLLQLLNGAVSGVFYGLMALGLSLILSLTRVINLAHGGFLVLGGYLGFTLQQATGFWPALLLAPLGVALVGTVVERLIVRPLYRRDPLESLLLTFGLAMVVEELVRMIWGPVGVPFQIPEGLRRPLFPGTSFFFVTGFRAFLIGTAILVAAALFLFLGRTRIGLTIRAAVQDSETLSALGTNVWRLYTLSFAIGVFMAGLAGVLAAGQLGLSPTMGSGLLMPSFVALIIGGVGSLGGSFLGGLLVGMASGLAGQFAATASELSIYVLLALTLLLRPRGLFGQEGFFE